MMMGVSLIVIVLGKTMMGKGITWKYLRTSNNCSIKHDQLKRVDVSACHQATTLPCPPFHPEMASSIMKMMMMRRILT